MKKQLLTFARDYNLPLTPIITSLAIMNYIFEKDDMKLSSDEIRIIIILACKIHNIPCLVPRLKSNEEHCKLETKILDMLNFNLFITDTAQLMISITDQLNCTDDESLFYLERMFIVHLDDRIKLFEYFNNDKKNEYKKNEKKVNKNNQKSNTYIHLKPNDNNYSHTKVLDCCLALLKDEDLVKYEIIHGENRPNCINALREEFSIK